MTATSLVFPTLPGLAWPVTKRPVTQTIVQTTASGRELRASTWGSPLLEWGLQYEVLRSQSVLGVSYTEYEDLAAFFSQVRGRTDSFLFEDLTDNATTSSVFGEGDGVTRTFTLKRTQYLGAIAIGDAVTITSVKIDGVSTGAYTISGNQITFSSAPAPCAELSWAGTYRFRVRFREPSIDFSNFLEHLWESKSVWLRQVK